MVHIDDDYDPDDKNNGIKNPWKSCFEQFQYEHQTSSFLKPGLSSKGCLSKKFMRPRLKHLKI